MPPVLGDATADPPYMLRAAYQQASYGH
ncbi:hypothetical protein A2U01_0047746, partial [Trifolium medium]|nr:hypothetical protein [Trifolium medium]